ncbi:MAG: Gfo/Idh/MocA family oxidoreductase [Terriglobales bacterium]
MAIAGLQAGKHVYVEKPCSHNPAEGEMLLQAQQKYRKLVQIGHTAALFAPHDRDHQENPRRLHRQALLCEGLVQQREDVDWYRQRSTCAVAAGLGSVAGAGAAPSL